MRSRNWLKCSSSTRSDVGCIRRRTGGPPDFGVHDPLFKESNVSPIENYKKVEPAAQHS